MSPERMSVPSSGRRDANFLKDKRMSSKSLKKSKWSASIFKIIPQCGDNVRKLSTYSQASQTRISLLPTLPLVPVNGNLPPITAEGSKSLSIKNLTDSNYIKVKIYNKTVASKQFLIKARLALDLA